MKKLLSVLLVLLSIIVSGCGEESDATKALKEAAEKNLKLAQVQDKTAVEYARELGATIYHTTCKVHKFANKYAEEEKKLIDEVDKLKGKAVLNMVDAGSKNIFNMSKADGVKELQEAAEKVKDYQAKHKDYNAAADAYLKSISAVIQMNNVTLRKKNDSIDPFIKSKVVELAKNNNYKENIDFGNLDTYKYGWTKLNENRADERAAERRSLTMLGKITDARAELVKDLTANPTKIRKLNVGEKVEVNEKRSDGPNLYVIVYPTGESGYVWHKYVKYDGYKTQEAIDEFLKEPGTASQPSNDNPSSSNNNVGIINGDEVNVRKGPGVKYDSLGVFFKGDKVRLVGEQGNDIGENWYQIEYDNPSAGLIKGWVRKDFINVSKGK